jgi:mitochondrial fission protein ELM1
MRVWLLLGHKAGDNTQVQALADELGWPCEAKKMFYRPWELLSNRLLGVTLAGINKRSSSPLHAPWPDLVITAGRRNEPVARWIREKSGGATRLVHIGRPWAPLDSFDLIVTTPQYFLPERNSILHNRLPLYRLDVGKLEAAANKWSQQFRSLQKPWLAVLIGGDSGPFVFTPQKAALLGQQVNRRAAATDASVLISNSARTPPRALERFLGEIHAPYYLYQWGGSAANPYIGYLALADELVVTGESISMLAEAASTGKPLSIFDMSDAGLERVTGIHRPWWRYLHNFRYKPLTHRLAMRYGPERMRRDIGNIQRELVRSGQAVWLGQQPQQPGRYLCAGETQRTAERVRALFEPRV